MSGITPSEYEKILQKTQAVEAEMRADMMLVDEYGARGWEIEKILKWGDGDNVEIDMLNVDKGILAEVKSDVPDRKSLIDWLNDETEFKDRFIGRRIEGLKETGLIGKMHKFILVLPKEVIDSLTIEDITTIIKNVLKEEGVDWSVEIKVLNW